MAKVSGMYLMRTASTMRPPKRKTAAIRGTTFSVTEARRCTPPRKMNAQMATRTRPTTQDWIPKAVSIVAPMELDCTIQPIKPSARMMAVAKKPARNLPKRPLKTAVI